MKSFRLKGTSHLVFALMMLAFLFSQWCFLEADPDISMATGSRAAWTDDGILLCQIRNFLNGHDFQLMESDGFLKAPLYSAIQGLSMAVFGCEQVVARTTVLCLVVLSFFVLYFNNSSRPFMVIFLLSACTLIPVHQHAHLALAEMAAVSLVLLAALCIARYFQESKAFWMLLSQLAIVVAVGMKIQFLYLVILPVLCWWVFAKTHESDNNRLNNHARLMAFAVVVSFVLCLVYFWVFKNEWFVFQQAQSGSLSWHTISWDSFRNNCLSYLFRKKMFLFVLLFLISLFVFGKLIFNKNRRGALSVWSIFSFVWFLLELHKLPMDYLPMRYMVSFYVAMGLFSSAVFTDVWLAGLFPKIKTALFALVVLVFLVNVFVLAKAYNERTFVMKSIQERIGGTLNQDDVVVGPWAPALTWGSKCRSLPVWNGFSSRDQIKKSGSPTVVISEKGGLDSEFDWKRILGRDLESAADSVTYYKIADWRVGLYLTR
ncbi:MAG: ArnT family glycosyltransferase [Bacteroidota bacterium]